jgi:hypothetical protein
MSPIMLSLYNYLLRLFVPGRHFPSTEDRLQVILRALLVISIVLIAGPDLLAAFELRLLFELLGATLLATAFVGVRLMALDVAGVAMDMAFPRPEVSVLVSDAPLLQKASCATCIATNLAQWIAIAALYAVSIGMIMEQMR